MPTVKVNQADIGCIGDMLCAALTVNSWTDDLPICRQSGVGFSTNQVYREDGRRQEEHQLEDRSFYFHMDNTFLYGVLDGHNGTQFVDFAIQKFPAEILLGQIRTNMDNNGVKGVLSHAFDAVEKGYQEENGDLLAKRTSLLCELPKGLNSYQSFQKYPEIVCHLNNLNMQLSSGASCGLVLIHNNKIFVGNLGDVRVLLVRVDSEGILRILQLSTDHDLMNAEEKKRLIQLGISRECLEKCVKLGNQENTRCLGNCYVKSGYKEFHELKSAIAEPILSDVEIHEPIPLTESCRFLLLVSKGLIKALEQCIGNNQVNKELVQLILRELEVQTTLMGVAQAVVDQVGRMHHDLFMNSNGSKCQGREDMSLLIRIFHHPMGEAVQKNLQDKSDLNTASSASTTESSEVFSVQSSRSQMELDDKGRIIPYVDFTPFFEAEMAGKKVCPPEFSFLFE